MTPQTATDTRDRILEAAMGLFHARSFDGVGTDEICRAAGVNKGSLYHHFPGGKQEMAQAVFERIGSRFEAEVLAPLRRGGSPERRLVAWARAVGDFYADGRSNCLLGAMVLAGMGLFGRNDLGLRIPSALEMLLGCLVLDRVLCLLLGGQVPVPLSTDPFASTATWTAPLFAMEAFLLGMVILYDWVEGERLRRGLADHRSAGGRSAWMLGTVLLSLGLSAVVALLVGLRRGRAWQQPAVALTAVLCVPFAIQALTMWLFASFAGLLTPTLTTAAMGVVSLVWVVGAVRFNHGLWLASALWATHLMFYPSAVLSASLVMLSLAGLTVSATAWLAGILTKRKSWRVMGAVDLVVAWMFAAVALVSGATSGYILVLLVASAALLFAVTTLTQANEAALLDD